jgi:hypothetical protein
VLVDVDGVIGAFAGSPDEKCSLYGRLNLNKLSDTTADRVC